VRVRTARLPLTAYQNGEVLDLRYFVEWHTWLWVPAVRAVVGDPRRFAGKRVLELGCGKGRMACLFGLLGAQVTAVELPWISLDIAQAEVKKWHLEQQVSLQHFDGELARLPASEYDFIFCKSVLVIVPELVPFLGGLARLLRPDGRLLAVENMQRGTRLRKIRVRVVTLMTTGRFGRSSYVGFRGVTPVFLDTLRQAFDIVSYRESYGLVAAIEARRKSEAFL